MKVKQLRKIEAEEQINKEFLFQANKDFKLMNFICYL